MRSLIKMMLELMRIEILLMIAGGISNTLFGKYLHISKTDNRIIYLNIAVLILFIIWYVRKGQFSGWYPSKRDSQK